MPKAFPKPVAYLFFAIGLTSALCFRLIIIAEHTNPSWVRLLWYTAVITNMIFFLYRYHITLKRKHAVNDLNLLKRMDENAPLTPKEKDAVRFLLISITRSRENLNYLYIFILSAIAILIDIIYSLS